MSDRAAQASSRPPPSFGDIAQATHIRCCRQEGQHGLYGDAVELITHLQPFEAIDALTIYRLLQLRSDVFVVEQGDPYRDIDGRDLEPTTLHLWFAVHNIPVAYLRIVTEPDGAAAIGRFVVAHNLRGGGLGGRLMELAVSRLPGRRCRLNAQATQVSFYQQFGFVPVGEPRAKSRIPHVLMVREP